MEISGTQHIPAPRQAVWDALNDPAVLQRCLPGCESVQRDKDGSFKVVVATAVGPLRARFKGLLRLTEAQPPAACVMLFEGQGGPVGFGKGSSQVRLSETADGTELQYSAQAQIGGKLAQVGSRLLDSVARKMSDDFFKALRLQLAPADAAVGVATRQASPGVDADAAEPAEPAVSAARVLPPAAAPHPVPRAAAAARPGGGPLVPGWWLAIAAAAGSLATLAGVAAGR